MVRALACPLLAAALAASPAMAQPAETAADQVRRRQARIAELDRAGPTLRSVLVLNPAALDEARRLDGERAAGRSRGRLHGLPVLVKDNIDTRDMPTTAGSLALRDNHTGRDAPLVKGLRAAGAVILGKTNLSEWANFRSSDSLSGWSAVGGLTKNPHVLDRNACGSSTGSAVAVAAGLAFAAVGTETDGSITCPASQSGIVGFKPTVGLVSRTHVVPISSSQDTPGPMARTVEDAALLLTAMAGSDAADPATREADARKVDYAARLGPDALKGVRLGVVRYKTGRSAAVDALFESALADLRAAGAELVEITERIDEAPIDAAELTVLKAEFKATLNAYLASTPPSVKVRTLADLIAFNAATQRETVLFGQDILIESEEMKGLDDPEYLAARATSLRLSGPEGIDRLLKAHRVQALVAPTNGPASRNDLVTGGAWGGSVSTLPAVAGYPHLTVPMGNVKGLPVGLSFIGAAWSDAEILRFGHAYEQRSKRISAPSFRPTVEGGAEIERAFAPAT
jgi:amidase